jgi:hypothetical protein
MSTRPRRSGRNTRLATVRFYFDADILGLAQVVAGLRPDSTFPGDPGGLVQKRLRPPCPITSPNTPDLVWIPIVAQNGWAMITRDAAINRRPAERQAIIASSGKLFAIASPGPLSKWDQLEILMARWRDVERIAQGQGPFIYALSYSTARQIL